MEIERSEQSGDVAGALPGRQAQFQSHIYCTLWFITSHEALYNPGMGERRERSACMGRRRRRRKNGGGYDWGVAAPLCLFEMGKEDNTLKALKKYWISAVRALVRLNVSLLFHFLSLFSQWGFPHISIPRGNVQGGGCLGWGRVGLCRGLGHIKEIKHPLCQCAYMNRFTIFMTPTSPPLATYYLLSLSVSLNLSIYLSPPSPSLPQNSILYLLVMERSSAVLCQPP